MNRITVSLLSILVTTSLFFQGCTSRTSSAPDSVLIGLASPPATLDPRSATDAYGTRICELLFNSLVKLGPDLKVMGDAAESWTYKNKTYTFVLKPGLTFSNGRALQKDDILFSVEQFKAPTSSFKSNYETIESTDVVEKDGRFQVIMKLKKYAATFLTQDLPSLKLIPKAETLAAGLDFARQPIGTGSFKLASQNSNEIVLDARADHPFEAPKIKHVVFKIIRDDLTRSQKMLRGEIDVAQSELPLRKVKDFEKEPDRFSVNRLPGLSMTYLLINMEDPVLKNIEVRKAIAESLQRDEIIRYKLEGFAQKATSILSPNNPFHHAGLVQWPFEIGKAKDFFTKWSKTTKPVKLILKTSNSELPVENGKIISQQLRNAGLEIEVQSYEWGTYYDDVKKGNFQMALMRWVGVHDPDIYRMAFHSGEQNGGRNRGHYVNHKLDKLLEAGVSIENVNQRIQHYKNIQEVIHNDLPIIPLWYDDQVAVVSKKIKNYTLSRTGDYQFVKTVEKSE